MYLRHFALTPAFPRASSIGTGCHLPGVFAAIAAIERVLAAHDGASR